MKLSGYFKFALTFFLFLSFFFLMLEKNIYAQSKTTSLKENLLAQFRPCSYCDTYGNCRYNPAPCGEYQCITSSDCRGCYSDADCPRGYVCMDGKCVLVPTLPPPPPPPTATPPPPPPTPIPPGYSGRPRPTPYVPCNETRSPEFHSLRPYQASPCNLKYNDLAIYCGNDLILSDTITILKTFTPDFLTSSYTFEGRLIEPAIPEVPLVGKYCFHCSNGHCVGSLGENCIPDPIICDPGGPADQCSPHCKDNGNGTETCYFNVRRVRNIAIDLDKAYLPIMGFTEPSLQAESRPDRVINSVLQSETMDDAKKVNEYVSWYLNGVIGRAEYPPPNPDTDSGRKRIIDYSGPLKRLLASATQALIRTNEAGKAGSERHNQVVACTQGGNLVNCYPGLSGKTQVRLTGASGKTFSYVPFSSTEDRLGKVEIGTYSIQPPLSSGFKILGSAITNQKPATLFFSHMQEGSDLAKIIQRLSAYKDADLDAKPEPAVVSTSRFCDLRAIRSNPGDDLFAGEISATVTYDVQVKCLFAVLDPDIPGNLCRRLSEDEADCAPGNYWCDTNYGPVDCAAGQICGINCAPPAPRTPCAGPAFPIATCYPQSWGCAVVFEPPIVPCSGGLKCAMGCVQTISQINLTQTCTTNVRVAFRTISETPLATDIWKRLVANNVSVFRKIFPKIEDVDGRPIKRLWDIAGATGVVYKGEGVTVAGNPSVGRPANQGELYFPHIGGIHEYFLKCIQKTLRPQGYGDGCLSGPKPLTEGISIGDCATPPPPGAIPPGGGYCQLGTGYCSPSYLSRWFSGCHAKEASIICNMESGGNPSALNCGCLTGRSLDYSVGLFQINLLAHCDGAFDYSWGPPPSCSILDQDRVDACLEDWFDPDRNIAKAASLSKGGANWTPWGAYTNACQEEVDAQCP